MKKSYAMFLSNHWLIGARPPLLDTHVTFLLYPLPRSFACPADSLDGDAPVDAWTAVLVHPCGLDSRGPCGVSTRRKIARRHARFARGSPPRWQRAMNNGRRALPPLHRTLQAPHTTTATMRTDDEKLISLPLSGRVATRVRARDARIITHTVVSLTCARRPEAPKAHIGVVSRRHWCRRHTHVGRDPPTLTSH